MRLVYDLTANDPVGAAYEIRLILRLISLTASKLMYAAYCG
jgi:hypothetical protein